MNRRGFIFGAGAALAVVRAGLLMPVSSRLLLMPEPPVLVIPRDATVIIGESGEYWFEYFQHLNCRCVLLPSVEAFLAARREA